MPCDLELASIVSAPVCLAAEIALAISNFRVCEIHTYWARQSIWAGCAGALLDLRLPEAGAGFRKFRGWKAFVFRGSCLPGGQLTTRMLQRVTLGVTVPVRT